jgi:hypothetical protein
MENDKAVDQQTGEPTIFQTRYVAARKRWRDVFFRYLRRAPHPEGQIRVVPFKGYGYPGEDCCHMEDKAGAMITVEGTPPEVVTVLRSGTKEPYPGSGSSMKNVITHRFGDDRPFDALSRFSGLERFSGGVSAAFWDCTEDLLHAHEELVAGRELPRVPEHERASGDYPPCFGSSWNELRECVDCPVEAGCAHFKELEQDRKAYWTRKRLEKEGGGA